MRKTIFATLALTALISGETSAATTWTTVANEYQQFSVSGTKTVRYGAGSSWVQKSLSGTQTCSNQTFGKDPAYGLAKVCQVGTTTTSTSGTTSTSTTPTTSTTTTTTWSTVANEYASFSLSGTKTVRYGAGSSWIQKALAGTQYCSNETFGSDPARGVAKICQVATTTTSTSTGTTSGTTTGSTSTTTTTPTATWSTVATEYASFSLSSTKTVRYGAGSSWIEKSLSGTQSCTNETFGNDPAYGLAKVCQVSSSTTASTGTTSGSTSGTTTGSTGGTGSTTGSTGGTVVAPVSYSAKLAWTIPTARVDGSALPVGELAGYEVYYTNESGSVSISIPVAGGTTVNTVVSNLTSGKYYFSVSAVDTKGLKSALSTMALASFP